MRWSKCVGVGALLSIVCFGIPTGAAPSRVTRVLVRKSEHALHLYAGEQLLESYRVAIGPGGAGPKLREGDSKTPVGRYHVVGHWPSRYKVFLRLDYPNAEDRARFARLKRSGDLHPAATIGGDIGIHGPPKDFPDDRKSTLKDQDWTLGCIAVDDSEITEIAQRVPDGTTVDIED